MQSIFPTIIKSARYRVDSRVWTRPICVTGHARMRLMPLSICLVGLIVAGCSAPPPPPISFEFARTESPAEITTLSIAIRNDALVAPEGYTISTSGLPPKIRPNSGELLIVFGKLTLLVPNPNLTSIELIGGSTALGSFEGIAQPEFSRATVEEMSSAFAKHDWESKPLEEIGFVFRINSSEIKPGDSLQCRITWQVEDTNTTGSLSIPFTVSN